MIDENLLISKINLLAGLESTQRIHLKKITNTRISLQKILIKDDPSNLPIDEAINRPMTAIRRQEIYDVCVVIADDLLQSDD